jgi:uncharacterized protein
MFWSKTACTAFHGNEMIATGELQNVALVAKNTVDVSANDVKSRPVLIFNDATSAVIELDWRGSQDEFLEKFEAAAAMHDYQASQTQSPLGSTQLSLQNSEQDKPILRPLEENSPLKNKQVGRPKLGVVAREVTLLPRHWEWLATQTGGASVALRKLVEMARKDAELKDRVNRASGVTYKFMSTMAGHEPGFEEATRALFAKNRGLFEEIIKNWPADVNIHLKKLSIEAFEW